FDGRLSEFKTPIDVSEGTPFQKSVWKKLLDIPYGETATYGDVAERVGKPGAARAVGNAVGANPIPIVIPCHRVLASNGLGGYSGGIDIKKDLLRIEGTLS
ncbi:MAG TPA: methylated-DNA--[protein]-cysteine S-methyltransferase, partial [Thermodesulfobacteriota bacterium]|nr:methylated-DNA--[protein]-cysteine S-methyltransferase [Thermodesulfobacteriota bacterium]